jgi:tetratricopeptide (TPR) repeat protein
LDWEKPKLEYLMAGSVNSMLGIRPPVDVKPSRGSGGSGENEPRARKPSSETASEAETKAAGSWINQHPTNYYALTEQGKSLVQEKRFELAKEPLRRLIELYPTQTGSDSAYAMLAAAYRGLGETNAERQVLTQFAQQDDEANEAFLRLAELSVGADDWPAVVTNAHRSLAVDPLVSAPYHFLAQASRHSGNPIEAIQANRALLELDPSNPAEVHFELAQALHRTGDPGAMRQVLQALEEAPRYRHALQLLVQIHDAPAQKPSDATPSQAAKP